MSLIFSLIMICKLGMPNIYGVPSFFRALKAK